MVVGGNLNSPLNLFISFAKALMEQGFRSDLFLAKDTMVSVDSFTVPTIRFQILYVFLVLAHERRRILHLGLTAQPTAPYPKLERLRSLVDLASVDRPTQQFLSVAVSQTAECTGIAPSIKAQVCLAFIESPLRVKNQEPAMPWGMAAPAS